MFVKCKLLDENSKPKGREDTYSASDNLSAGEELDKQELIIVEQLPIITEKLKLVSNEIDKKIALAKSLPVTDETIQTVKKMRAALTKEFTAMEERRKAVKNAVLAPYEAFETIYKEYVSDKFKTADSDLKAEIDRNETARKDAKTEEIKTYFAEYATSKHIEPGIWTCAGIKIGLSDSISSLKKQAKEFIDQVESDLQLIETQEYKDEIRVEYDKSLNVSQAITTVAARHKAIEEQKQRQIELEEKRKVEVAAVEKVQEAIQEQQPLEPPKTIEPETLSEVEKTLVFKVTAPISKLKELKKFLDDGGYKYE